MLELRLLSHHRLLLLGKRWCHHLILALVRRRCLVVEGVGRLLLLRELLLHPLRLELLLGDL